MPGHDRRPHRRTLPRAAALAAAFVLATCATTPTPPRFDKPLVLLGEVHDHPQQHALRLDAFRAHLGRGARPALVMEQFDRRRRARRQRLELGLLQALHRARVGTRPADRRRQRRPR
jgi:hypothetical protein